MAMVAARSKTTAPATGTPVASSSTAAPSLPAAKTEQDQRIPTPVVDYKAFAAPPTAKSVPASVSVPAAAKEPIVISDSPPSKPATTHIPVTAAGATAGAKRKNRFDMDSSAFSDMIAGPDESAKKRGGASFSGGGSGSGRGRSPYEPPPRADATSARAPPASDRFDDSGKASRDFRAGPQAAAADRDFGRGAAPAERGQAMPSNRGGSRFSDADAHSAALIAPSGGNDSNVRIAPAAPTVSVLGGTHSSARPAQSVHSSVSSQQAADASKSRFGSAVINFDYEESSEDDMTSFSLKRKNGRKKAKLPASEQTTGSVNASGISNNCKRPPIYFDNRVRFEVNALPITDNPATSTGIAPITDTAALLGGDSRVPFEQRTPREADRSRKYDRDYHEDRERVERIASRRKGDTTEREPSRGAADWGSSGGVRADSYDRARERSRDRSPARSSDWNRDQDRRREGGRGWNGGGDSASDSYHRTDSRGGGDRDRDRDGRDSSGRARVPDSISSYRQTTERTYTSSSSYRSGVPSAPSVATERVIAAAEECEEVSWSFDTRRDPLPSSASTAETDWRRATAALRQMVGAFDDRPAAPADATSYGSSRSTSQGVSGQPVDRNRSAAPSRSSGGGSGGSGSAAGSQQAVPRGVYGPR